VVAVVATVVTGASVVLVSVELGVAEVEVGELTILFTTPDVVDVAAEVVPVTTPETVATVVLTVLGTTATVPVMVGVAASNSETS
jgi:hypothetical protein